MPTCRLSVRRLAVSTSAALALAAMPSTVAALPTSSGQSKPVTPGTWSDPRMEAQAPLVAAADRIQALAAGPGWDGFAGVGVDHVARSVVVFTAGDPPSTVDTVANGVRVEVKRVPYSLARLDAEARRIARQNPKVVTQVGPLPDFTGLSVAVGSTALLRTARTSIRSDLKITWTVRRAPARAFWRWDDSSPFFGGAAIDRLTNPITRTYAYCTTGFAARKSSGQEAMITARHCGTNVDWRTPVGDRFVGRTEGGNAALDATVMTGADYSPAIYVGTWDSSLARTVVGAGNPAQNSWVFPSGSFSGAWVVQVRQVNQYANVEGQLTGPGFFTEDSSRRGVVGNGDSGGPVAQGATTTTVTARGIIDAIDLRAEAPCLGRTDSGRRCAWRAFHVNIAQVLSGLGLTIQTG